MKAIERNDRIGPRLAHVWTKGGEVRQPEAAQIQFLKVDWLQKAAFRL